MNLLFKRLFLRCWKVVSFPEENKLWRLYTNGRERIDKEFDIVKIIKALRNLKILLKRQFEQDWKLRMDVNNVGKNVINIDSEDDYKSSLTSSNSSDNSCEDENENENEDEDEDGDENEEQPQPVNVKLKRTVLNNEMGRS